MLSPSHFHPSLPPHCSPTTDFLSRFSSTFHTCVPDPLAFLSLSLGNLSILAWLFAQLPQIYKNWTLSSTSGLSIYFLVEWCLGDLSNLLGALFTHQARWQVVIGIYYVFVDFCLVGQWVWYEGLGHGREARLALVQDDMGDSDRWSRGDMQAVVIQGVPAMAASGSGASTRSLIGDTPTQPKRIPEPQVSFREPDFGKNAAEDDEKSSCFLPAAPSTGNSIHRSGPSSPIPSLSPRTVLLLVGILAILQVHAAPVHERKHMLISAAEPNALEKAGTVLSWLSTALYLGSRLPQLIKNWRRQSTAGLSPQLFGAAFCGNLFYSAALLTNPKGWRDFGPYGGGGWADAAGSDRATWVLAALPFFLGAAGVLGLDASVGVQFVMYSGCKREHVVVRDGLGRRRRWRRASGWMRGWIPSMSEEAKGEQDALLDRHRGHIGDYGAACSDN